jgi:hypothetical protein
MSKVNHGTYQSLNSGDYININESNIPNMRVSKTPHHNFTHTQGFRSKRNKDVRSLGREAPSDFN